MAVAEKHPAGLYLGFLEQGAGKSPRNSLKERSLERRKSNSMEPDLKTEQIRLSMQTQIKHGVCQAWQALQNLH